MAVRPVLLYPHPALKQAAAPVDLVDDRAIIEQAVTDLLDTMASFPGCVGLTAPQIAIPVCIAVVDVTGHRKAKSSHGVMVLINPQIVSDEGSEVGREGCLSLPDLTANVRRASSIVVQACLPHGQLQTYICDAFEARATQHEIDHLDGLLFLDRVESARDIFPRKVYQH